MRQLSNQENILLFKYLDNDMTLEERSKFEELLKKNKVLHEELELEKRLFQVGKSVSEEIKKYEDEKRIDDEKPNVLLKKATEIWKNHESTLAQKNHLLQREVKNIINEENGNLKGTGNQPLLVKDNETAYLFEEEDKAKRLYPYKWLAAAAVIVLVSFGATLWYYQNENHEPAIAIIKNEPTSSSEVKDKSSSINKNDLPTHPTPNNSKVKAEKEKTIDKNLKQREIPSKQRYRQNDLNINSSFSERLFAKNFESDNLPSKVPDFLEDPSINYKENKHQEAIKEYEKVLEDIKNLENSGITSRNRSTIELTSFYAHYYIAQSCMYLNQRKNSLVTAKEEKLNTEKAIREFEVALTKAPDAIWKIKAQWYLSLAYLKSGQIQRAETLLEEVTTNDNVTEYKLKAIKLIKELKEK